MPEQLAYDERAEQSVLGCLLHNPGTFADLTGLRAEHFYVPANEKIYATLLRMYSDGESIDTITLFAKLEKSQELLRVGGAPYLSDLLQAFKSADNVAAYAAIVIDQWKLRQIKQLAQRFAQIHNTAAADEVDAALGDARAFLDGVDDSRDAQSLDFRALYECWQEDQADDRPTIETPFLSLNDRLNGGLRRQRQYVIAARPGAGKSVLLTQIAVYAALSHHSCLFFSLELGRADLMGRILACGAHADYAEITRKKMSADTYSRVSRWSSACAELPLSVDDEPGLSIEEIAQRCRVHKQRKGLDVVFIDYVGLVEATRGESRVLQVDHICTRARAIARQLDVSVVLACQLNRKVEDHGGRPRLPVMSDLRESGGVEQTADVVMILSRPPDDNGEEATQLPLMNCVIAKNRTGTTGLIQLGERFDQMRFENAC